MDLKGETDMTDPARFWDRAARKYAAAPIKDMAAYEYTLDRTRAYLKPTDRVLELGRGTGSTALLLAGSVAQYHGTDISPEMIRIARDKADSDAVETITFTAATGRRWHRRGGAGRSHPGVQPAAPAARRRACHRGRAAQPATGGLVHIQDRVPGRALDRAAPVRLSRRDPADAAAWALHPTCGPSHSTAWSGPSSPRASTWSRPAPARR